MLKHYTVPLINVCPLVPRPNLLVVIKAWILVSLTSQHTKEKPCHIVSVEERRKKAISFLPRSSHIRLSVSQLIVNTIMKQNKLQDSFLYYEIT